MKSSLGGGLPILVAGLWRHLSVRRRRQFLVLLCLIAVSAFAEVFTLGAVLPFLGVLVAPEKVFHQPAVAGFVHYFGLTAASQLIVPLTVVFVSMAVVAGAIRMLLLSLSTRLAYAAGSDFSVAVYRRTLYQPYAVHVARNSSEVISEVTRNVDETVHVLNQLLLLVSSALLLAVVTVVLIAIGPTAVLLGIVGLGCSYGLITWLYRRRLRRNSNQITAENMHVIKALQEGLGGIRDVLLDGTQPVYCEIYARADRELRRAQGNNQFVSGNPRFIMEALGMVLIAALAYGISRQPGGISSALPVLGALALGSQRLLPTLQQCYAAWANIAGCQASVVRIIRLMDQPLPAQEFLTFAEPLPFREEICLNAIRFRYNNDGPWVLEDLNLNIRKGARVGLVGTTGSGKSTALDLLMGLLTPTQGEVLVDGQPVTGPRVRSWQRTIAHVPQHIFLADTSVAENIAFGVPREAIDLERVKQAARQAQLADFIESRPEGYESFVGERGVRLSGGQRQRIGIARALYKQAALLIFDEATSALDTTTERSVMEAINGLNRDITVVLIAHRLSTVQHCDLIVQLEHGRVVEQGTYEQLLERSPSFRKLARAVA